MNSSNSVHNRNSNKSGTVSAGAVAMYVRELFKKALAIRVVVVGDIAVAVAV